MLMRMFKLERAVALRQTIKLVWPKNCDFCEHVKFGAILWKNVYFVNNCLKLKSKNPFAHMWHI